MINGVAERITKAARAVTLRHPNSMDATIYRKVFKRANDTGETMGGAPTLGGLGVLTPEDEDQFEYVEMGEAKILIVSRFDGTLDTSDRHDATVPGVEMQEALVEPLPNEKFTMKKYDLVAAMPGGGVVLALEVLMLPSTTSIFPFTTKYIVAPRDDLNSLTPWTDQ